MLDFASLQTRLGRVRPSKELLAEVPVVLVAFDLLHRPAQRPARGAAPRAPRARSRRSSLPERTAERILLSHLATRASAAEVDRHFDDARERHNEGLMVKDPESTLPAGPAGLRLAEAEEGARHPRLRRGRRRVGPRQAPRRAERLHLRGARDRRAEATLLTIGKAYTGLTDAEIADDDRATSSRITLQDFGRYRTVVPEVVVEIAFDRIMRSARHRSGFAMRFPRIVRMRDDKTPAEIDTLATVEALFGEQASGASCWRPAPRGETERIAAIGIRRDRRTAAPCRVEDRRDGLRCRQASAQRRGRYGRPLYGRLPYLRSMRDAIQRGSRRSSTS